MPRNSSCHAPVRLHRAIHPMSHRKRWAANLKPDFGVNLGLILCRHPDIAPARTGLARSCVQRAGRSSLKNSVPFRGNSSRSDSRSRCGWSSTRPRSLLNPNGIASFSPAVARNDLPWVPCRKGLQPCKGCVTRFPSRRPSNGRNLLRRARSEPRAPIVHRVGDPGGCSSVLNTSTLNIDP
jgi:hypothetical protein